MPSLDIISVNLWQIIVSLANLLLLFLILRKFLYAPVKKAMASRQQHIEEQIEAAQNDKDAAQALRISYEEKLENAAAQSDEIIKTAVSRAKVQEEQIVKDANETAAKTIARAEAQIEQERKKAVNDLKDQVSELAVDIASAVIGKNLSETDNSDIVDKFIDTLGETK